MFNTATIISLGFTLPTAKRHLGRRIFPPCSSAVSQSLSFSTNGSFKRFYMYTDTRTRANEPPIQQASMQPDAQALDEIVQRFYRTVRQREEHIISEALPPRRHQTKHRMPVDPNKQLTSAFPSICNRFLVSIRPTRRRFARTRRRRAGSTVELVGSASSSRETHEEKRTETNRGDVSLRRNNCIIPLYVPTTVKPSEGFFP